MFGTFLEAAAHRAHRVHAHRHVRHPSHATHALLHSHATHAWLLHSHATHALLHSHATHARVLHSHATHTWLHPPHLGHAGLHAGHRAVERSVRKHHGAAASHAAHVLLEVVGRFLLLRLCRLELLQTLLELVHVVDD